MENNTQVKREVAQNSSKSGMGVFEIILVAILLAAGAALKMTVGSVINFFGMKPNFIIAMYCLAICLIKPKLYEGLIIGLIAGAVCQLMPGTPYLNFASEAAGAVCMCLMLRVPLHIGKLNAHDFISTFVSTVVSGGLFVVCLFVFIKMDTSGMVAYVPIVLFTALINSFIVQALALPLAKVIRKK